MFGALKPGFRSLATLNRKEQLRHRAVSLRQHGFLVMPPPVTDRCGGCIMFSGCASVSACIRASGRASRKVYQHDRKFLKTSGRNFSKLWLTDELIRFKGREF